MIFQHFYRQIQFSRTIQERPLNSSTFQACANPDFTPLFLQFTLLFLDFTRNEPHQAFEAKYKFIANIVGSCLYYYMPTMYTKIRLLLKDRHLLEFWRHQKVFLIITYYWILIKEIRFIKGNLKAPPLSRRYLIELKRNKKFGHSLQPDYTLLQVAF